MKVTTIGVELAKNVFQVHGADAKGRMVFKKRLSRGKIHMVVERCQEKVVDWFERDRQVNASVHKWFVALKAADRDLPWVVLFYPIRSVTGLPSLNIWLRISTPIIASVFWAGRSRDRKPGPMIRL